MYNFIYDWLKAGLITSSGKHWKHRRRLLTPAFHKEVLLDFVEVINEKSQIMINLLASKAKAR